MANFIQQLNAGGVTYDLHDSEFIIDTRSESGAALTGTSKASALFDGMQITYWLNYAAASNATLNLTLADGTTTGAIPCYYNGTTRMGTQYAAGNVIRFTYRENVTIGSTSIAAGWWGDANYTVSDTNYDIFGTSLKVDTYIGAYGLCGITGVDGTISKQTRTYAAGTYWKLNGFTQSGGTGQTKKATTKGYYPYKIFYITSSSALDTAGGTTSTIASGTNNVDLRYTVNGSTSANIGVTGAPFFFVGTIGNDGLFYLKGTEDTAEWWQCGIPTTKQTDYVYWFVGVMSSKYQCRLNDRNWFIKWTGTGENDTLVYFEPWLSVDWNNISGKPSTFTPSSHTHGKISNQGAITNTATISSGDRLIIADATGSNTGELVASSITFGSSTTTYLRNDGTWGTVDSDDHMLVMTGTPTGDLTSAPITTTTSWTDYTTAVTNHDRLVLNIPLASISIELQAQESNGSVVNAVVHNGINSQVFISTVAFRATEDSTTHNVKFQYDATILPYTALADEASYVWWSGVQNKPNWITDPESTLSNGTYSLEVSSGSVSWTPTVSSDLPDLPSPGMETEGYYLQVDPTGNGSWDYLSNATVNYATSASIANSADTADSFAGSESLSEGKYRLDISSGGAVAWEADDAVNVPDAPDTDGNYILGIDVDDSDPLNPIISSSWAEIGSSSALSSASLSGGVTPTITYSAATASKATLTNGLLSFGDVSASNITNWSAGSMPTISTNTITVVTPASS